MSALVVVTEPAEQQIREALLWWERNASAGVFIDEMERGLWLLAEAPGAGSLFTRAARPGTRRLLLRTVKHWLYYTADPVHEIVYILALWGNRREGDPPGL